MCRNLIKGVTTNVNVSHKLKTADQITQIDQPASIGVYMFILYWYSFLISAAKSKHVLFRAWPLADAVCHANVCKQKDENNS